MFQTLNMETFVTAILDDIKEAGLKNENFDLHLEAEYTKVLAEKIDNIQWIEVY